MIDMAADVPPLKTSGSITIWVLTWYVFPGKAMCGPQSTDLLMGKKDLIAAAGSMALRWRQYRAWYESEQGRDHWHVRGTKTAI